MKDPHAATKAEIKRLAKVWQQRLGLSEYHIDVQFSDDVAMADCHAQWQYLMATLTFNPGECAEQAARDPLETLELTVVHELTHVLLSGYRALRKGRQDLFTTVDERTTEEVARLFVQAYAA